MANQSNRLKAVNSDNGSRIFNYNRSGDIKRDRFGDSDKRFAYNKAGRLAVVKEGTVTTSSYVYNANGQLVFRQSTSLDGLVRQRVHYLHDLKLLLGATSSRKRTIMAIYYVNISGSRP